MNKCQRFCDWFYGQNDKLYDHFDRMKSPFVSLRIYNRTNLNFLLPPNHWFSEKREKRREEKWDNPFYLLSFVCINFKQFFPRPKQMSLAEDDEKYGQFECVRNGIQINSDSMTFSQSNINVAFSHITATLGWNDICNQPVDRLWFGLIFKYKYSSIRHLDTTKFVRWKLWIFRSFGA